MKFYLLVFMMIPLYFSSIAQKLKPGTYTFDYCDLEYPMCLGPCKVVIKGDSIAVYATKELAQRRTFTKEGDLIDLGLILKHRTGKWIVAHSMKDTIAKKIGYDGPAIIDLKKKQYWTY